FYASISGAICLVLLIYSGKTGDDLLYPLILTIAVSTLAFFTVLLEAVFTVFFVGWSLVLDQSRHVNYLDAITMGNVKSAITPIIFFIPLASVFALDAAR
ncbi:hypothetical protein, partial [Donghicola mangrovi]|uniref:hypothetical protein n=1 Tax=Donghicola mangrovi TaxID=2729614 RepID=UPI001D14464F